MKLTLLTAILLAPLAALHAGELTLGAVFSDHMVLQRDKAVAVWGLADRGEQITVEFAGQKKTTIVGVDGKWSTPFSPPPVWPSAPLTASTPKANS
jgi:sialate O-acetylesterase